LPQPILARADLLQIAPARDRIDAGVAPPGATATVLEIDPSQCWVGGCRTWCAGLPPGSYAPVSTGERTKQAGRNLMSVAEQAFLLTGELFVLSFVAIYAIWFADRLRRNFSGKA
jgi:hypothetical protein